MTAIPVSSTTLVPAWQWSPDVLKFATEHGVAAYLEPMLEATRHVFPTARLIEVNFEPDPECSAYDGILFKVYVPSADIPDIVGAYRSWNTDSYQCCPAPLVGNFLLRVFREGT